MRAHGSRARGRRRPVLRSVAQSRAAARIASFSQALFVIRARARRKSLQSLTQKIQVCWGKGIGR